MKKIFSAIPGLLALTAFVLSSCVSRPDATDIKAGQPHLITGTFKVTNDFVLTRYYVENAVSLVDMHGFVTRDEEWELPVPADLVAEARILCRWLLPDWR